MSFTKNVKTLRGIIKNDANHLTTKQLDEVIKICETWLKDMPEVNEHGLFLGDRKVLISGLLMKLNFIRLDKDGLKTSEPIFVQKEGLN